MSWNFPYKTRIDTLTVGVSAITQTPLLHICQAKESNPLNLTVKAGALITLTGPSGSGKSRFLRALCDLDPNELSVSLNGHARNKMPPSQWRQQLQYLPAEPVWWTETAADVIPEPQQQLAESIGLTNVLLNQPLARLSTGERQRAALLRALGVEPTLLLLDEPTAALDEEATKQVEALLVDWVKQKSRAIIWVTHDADQRRRIGGPQWLIQNGDLACQ